MTKELKQYIALLLANQISLMKHIDEHCQLDEEIKQTQLAIIELTKEREDNKDGQIKNLDKINTIFNFWNESKSWQHHRKIKEHVSSIKAVLNEFSVDEVKKAIENYVFVVESDEMFFKYKWTLKDFLKRGFLNFVESADPRNNYKRRVKNGYSEESIKLDSEKSFDYVNSVFRS